MRVVQLTFFLIIVSSFFEQDQNVSLLDAQWWDTREYNSKLHICTDQPELTWMVRR